MSKPFTRKDQKGSIAPVVLIAVLFLAAAIGTGIYYFTAQKSSRQNSFDQNSSQSQTQDNPQPQSGSFPNENGSAPSSAKLVENRYEGEDFSVAIPEGWAKSQQPLSGTLLTLYKIGESHADDPNAQKINFKSYIAISFDRTQGETQSQIFDMTKKILLQTLPNAKIGALSPETIDNQKADLIEIRLTQMDVQFKVLVAVVIKGDTYFTVSANTTEKKWDSYKADFYAVLKSMALKDTPSSSSSP